jgi:hypothetical protein
VETRTSTAMATMAWLVASLGIAAGWRFVVGTLLCSCVVPVEFAPSVCVTFVLLTYLKLRHDNYSSNLP